MSYVSPAMQGSQYLPTQYPTHSQLQSPYQPMQPLHPSVIQPPLPSSDVTPSYPPSYHSYHSIPNYGLTLAPSVAAVSSASAAQYLAYPGAGAGMASLSQGCFSQPSIPALSSLSSYSVAGCVPVPSVAPPVPVPSSPARSYSSHGFGGLPSSPYGLSAFPASPSTAIYAPAPPATVASSAFSPKISAIVSSLPPSSPRPDAIPSVRMLCVSAAHCTALHCTALHCSLCHFALFLWCVYTHIPVYDMCM